MIRLFISAKIDDISHCPLYDGNGRILNVLYLVLNNLLDSPILYLSNYINKIKINTINSLLNLEKIIAEEGLNKDRTYNFIQKSFEQGRVETNGTEVSGILPPMNMFTPNNERQEKRNKVIDKLVEFFDKFFSLSNNKF